MSEQKREVVIDTFINVHYVALSNLPWALAQARQIGLVLASRTHLNGLTTSVQAPPYLLPRL